MRVAYLTVGLLVIAGAIGPRLDAAQPLQIAGATCSAPPILHCPDANCPGEVVADGGPVVEAKTGRNYFLDYPCDLERGEPVTFILSLHGGGSYGNWQRHYFPLLDYVTKHRLVVATPFSPRRVWTAEDDTYLQNIVSGVIDDLGASNIKAFWLVGHSQDCFFRYVCVRTSIFAQAESQTQWLLTKSLESQTSYRNTSIYFNVTNLLGINLILVSID
jgi:hypothetical protein